MSGPDPLQFGWWLLSRAAGVTSYALASIAVVAGLAMSGRVSDRPGGARALRATHEHAAIAALIFLVVHVATLLPDPWMHPSVAGLLVPGLIGYRPAAVAAGIVGAYMAAALGLSFYARRRIGAARWRRLHRLTIVAWALSVAHLLAAGTDATTLWMRLVLAATAPPIVVLFAARLREGRRRSAGRGVLPDGARRPQRLGGDPVRP
ncbi:MAG: methionine sulfoxide reductase heme-binding subunit [Solirubrobacteraceae bacterium]|jgi:sulfoxide reductase heme-binding subunit YedZ|nr:methionine sulfoxide reductase heme-binding subunit [Solirubrobacteraceae bacterium]